jgi:hypothetical protein
MVISPAGRDVVSIVVSHEIPYHIQISRIFHWMDPPLSLHVTHHRHSMLNWVPNGYSGGHATTLPISWLVNTWPSAVVEQSPQHPQLVQTSAL